MSEMTPAKVISTATGHATYLTGLTSSKIGEALIAMTPRYTVNVTSTVTVAATFWIGPTSPKIGAAQTAQSFSRYLHQYTCLDLHRFADQSLFAIAAFDGQNHNSAALYRCSPLLITEQNLSGAHAIPNSGSVSSCSREGSPYLVATVAEAGKAEKNLPPVRLRNNAARRIFRNNSVSDKPEATQPFDALGCYLLYTSSGIESTGSNSMFV